MNIKLHTPKSLKKGSGISSLKQFLLSLVATTISIALTFGTAAIIDNHKKKAAKREIVMMVMYDMYNSLQLVANADSMIHESMDLQLKFAKNPSLSTLPINSGPKNNTSTSARSTQYLISSESYR